MEVISRTFDFHNVAQGTYLVSARIDGAGTRLTQTAGTIGVQPAVLFDGIVMHVELKPGSKPGDATFSLTCRDVSAAMDREERIAEHTAEPDGIVALQLIARYAQYGLVPEVIPPASFDVPVPTDRTPVQRSTDFQHLVEMAKRYAYVFFVTPGPLPGMNHAYWGPPPRMDIPQPALSVDLGPDSNLKSINFQFDAAAATKVEGKVPDRSNNRTSTIRVATSTRPGQSSCAAEGAGIAPGLHRRPALSCRWASVFHTTEPTLRSSSGNTSFPCGAESGACIREPPTDIRPARCRS